jgi:hypothetical protein
MSGLIRPPDLNPDERILQRVGLGSPSEDCKKQ